MCAGYPGRHLSTEKELKKLFRKARNERKRTLAKDTDGILNRTLEVYQAKIYGHSAYRFLDRKVVPNLMSTTLVEQMDLTTLPPRTFRVRNGTKAI